LPPQTDNSEDCLSFEDISHFPSETILIKMVEMLKADLKSMQLFQNLDDKSLELLLPIIEPVKLPTGMRVFDQDAPTQYFYLLKEGEVAILFKPHDGEMLQVTTIRPGRIFGWSAALCRDCYTSAAVTLTDCLAFRIIGKELQRFRQKHPDAGQRILESLSYEVSNRLYNTHDQVMELLQQRFKASMSMVQQGEKHG
jgi:CRP/FNR family cyclic AMP-dependent transcriptional regulator